jgi:copper chaperone CopZ
MLKKMLSIATIVCLCFSVSLLAKDIKKVDITAQMECGSCKNKIERTLNKTEGVSKVAVDLKAQNVKVEYDKDVITDAQLCKMINDLDIPASIGGSKNAQSTKSCCDKPCETKKCDMDKNSKTKSDKKSTK